MQERRVRVLYLLLLANTAYVAAFASPTIFYMTNVLLHVVLGLAFLIAWWIVRGSRRYLLLACGLLGLYVAIRGNTFPQRWALGLHIVAGVAFVFIVMPWKRRYAAAVTAMVAGMVLYRVYGPHPMNRIRNTLPVPISMREEGGGPQSPFWPSASKTNVGGIIPANFFMDSEVCGECHRDIYRQFTSSAHKFASFNNQFYRKSIEYMQDINGVQSSKWCAGCHDHAVFFNGRFDKPIRDQIDTPEARNGLACVSCHAITHVNGSIGNGGFTVEYPPLHELAASKNRIVRAVDYLLTYLDPEPHRRTFMKPFMRQDASEFCSTCHKVHLDVPVNNYRWIRGFNDYDNWQASAVSGQGARSFYYPPKSSTCNDCHMPLVASSDPGNRNGMVHSHRFAAANTALAAVNEDEEQMKQVVKNLQSGFITVDIFAISPSEQSKGEVEMQRRSEGPALASTFAVGEEAETPAQAVIRDVGKLAAPVDRGARIEPGSSVRVDVVVRTRKIGHFFPGGTVDSFDVWLELTAKDGDGKPVFWSGQVEDNGKGPVEEGAHFYRSYLLDAEGNPINKRNAWQARSLLYVRLIPPGAADVAHYRVRIPPDAKGPIRFEAKLNYRKFSHYYTQFAYAGAPEKGQGAELVSVHHDSRRFRFDPASIPSNVSGKVRDRIPDLPVVTLATSRVEVPLGSPEWWPKVQKADRERWNDWGIGLLLQGDLKAAEYAFTRVTEAEPGYPDGWLNVARALIQEGETDRAKPYIEKALQLDSSLGRIHFFKAMIQKADGDYDGALQSLRVVTSQYPRDRVALNQMGRILFLKREYSEAVHTLQNVLDVDPEDVQAHYNLMLCYRGLRMTADAEREELAFRRFKADEASQAITARQRLISPEDNNERQSIHEHESVRLK